MTMTITSQEPLTQVIDKHFSVKCPHCSAFSGLSAISIPSYELLQRYRPERVGIAYQCDACREPVFLRFSVHYDFGNLRIHIEDRTREEVERPQEEYEFQYLPSPIKEDFRETLSCYSNSCFNAFAAMCRRTIQSAAAKLGVQGKDKVQKQVDDLKGTAGVDDDTFEVLKAIVVAGHDGSHPHLPPLSPDRAQILLELIRDVLYQLFVRKAKIEEAALKRKEAIDAKRKSGGAG